LILAAIAICWYASKKGIKIIHLVDAAGLALLLAYAVGRIGCQVSGDGDWGIFNSAYVLNSERRVVEAGPGDYEAQLNRNASYYLKGMVYDKDSMLVPVTDRVYPGLDKVPAKSWKGPSFLPTWMVAYTYPNNVNKDGILIPGCQEEHCRELPQPVFPTPIYETLVCTILFILLWSIRRRIKVPGVMFGIYLILNGLERFIVELFRVNNTYSFLGLHPTQAEIISTLLVLTGIGLIIFVKMRASRNE
jgi:phosphatidylglycerol---prolipoprotein diacylglyceryl transferase